MRKIYFYRKANNEAPVEKFLDTLSDKEAEKVLWVLRLIREHDKVPKEYFQKLKNTQDIWEVRASYGKNEFRLLGFWYESNLIILTNGFRKKTQKTPKSEIELAESRKKDYLKRRSYG